MSFENVMTHMPITCSQTVPFYSDPGHGWAKVHVDHLADYGVLDKITPYSYQRGSWVYLEEDCDLSTFIDAARAKGVGIRLKEMKPANNYSRIRSYDRYKTPSGITYQYQFNAA